MFEAVDAKQITKIKDSSDFPAMFKLKDLISSGRDKITAYKHTTENKKEIPAKVRNMIKEIMSQIFSYLTDFEIRRGYDEKRASHSNGLIYIHNKLTNKMENLFSIRDDDSFKRQLESFIKELDSSLTHELVHKNQEGESVSLKSGAKKHLSSWKEVEAYAIQIADYLKKSGIKKEHILSKINQILLPSKYAQKLAEKAGLQLVLNKLRMYKETVDPETFNTLINKVLENS